MKISAATFTIWVLLSSVALCQSPPAPRFEVASVKPADPGSHVSSVAWEPGGRLTVVNEPLRSLIMMAYDIHDFQLSGGPGWIESEHFDIIATTDRSDEQTTAMEEQRREKLRALLETRFGLVVHREKKDQPVYILTVAKRGPKMKVATADEPQHIRGGSAGSQGSAVTTTMLADVLSNATGRRVLDKTSLTEKYDYDLDWAPDIAQSGDNRPTIFTAVQEHLGLQLKSSRAPVDMIVVDHVERPSAN